MKTPQLGRRRGGSLVLAASGMIIGSMAAVACLVDTDGLSTDEQMDSEAGLVGDATMPDAAADSAGSSNPADAANSLMDASDDDAKESAIPDAQMDTGPAVLPYDQVILADTPAAYWPLDEVAGTNVAIDLVGGRAAVAQGTVDFGVAGVSGTSARFTAGARLSPGDYFDVLGQDPFALEVWVKADGFGGDQGMFSKRAMASSDGYVLYGGGSTASSASVSFEEDWTADGGGTRGAFGGVDFSADWVHLVVTLDVTNRIHLYINGVDQPSTYNGAGGPSPDGITLSFGASLTGELDEIALYNHTLSAVQVNAHYQARTK